MKLRKPDGPAPHVKALDAFTTDFGVELITPLYGGGVKAGEPDNGMPIRASGIRGQLRFWWRLLHRNSYPAPCDLFDAETAVFGGFSHEGLPVASRVRVRVSKVSAFHDAPCATYKEQADGSFKTTPDFPHGPGYAQWPGQGKAHRINGITDPPKRIGLPGLRFTLTISVLPGGSVAPKTLWESDVLPALRWWASFGGIGARTRRGMGAVRIDSVQPVSAREATGLGCRLAQMPHSNTNAKEMWEKAIEKLRSFRQGVDMGRNPGSGKDPRRPPGRSRWPEPDTIREITGCHLVHPGPPLPPKNHAPGHPSRQSFPRAVFGLPIVFHFKDGPQEYHDAAQRKKMDPADATLYPLVDQKKPVVDPKKCERMASPLILKPMWTGHNFVPIALLLPRGHVGTMGVHLESRDANSQEQPNDFPAGHWWPDAHRKTMVDGVTPNPLKNKTGDVLSDFMKFFEG
ncbi:MAG: type III-B CRISPR module RAMP protein Cmr1 [Nitrospirae bacterium]|nr:type III-B CRISPR module RAMP protein Cmr1 [Nitrospirota bacterium]